MTDVLLNIGPVGGVAASGKGAAKGAEGESEGEGGAFAVLLQRFQVPEVEAAEGQGLNVAADAEGAELLLDLLGQSFDLIAEGIPQEGLSRAGWSRVEQALVAAVEGAFAGAGIAMPEGMVAAIEARFEVGSKPFEFGFKRFEAVQSDVRGLVAGVLKFAASRGAAAIQAGANGAPGTVPVPFAAQLAEMPADLGSSRRPPEPLHLGSEARPRSMDARVGALGPDAAALRATAANTAEPAVVVQAQGGPGPQAARVEVPPPMAPIMPATQTIQAPEAEIAQMTRPETAQAARPDIAPSVLSQIRGGRVAEGRTRIELSPASLGTLEIELSSDEAGQLRVVIRAESPATLAALRSDRQGLADLLADSGFAFDQSHLDFEGFDRGEERAPSQQGAAITALETIAAEADLPLPHPTGTPLSRPVEAGRLDILT